MGNEMGNSNTSGLQEEENSIPQGEGKSVQEAGHADGADLENHTVPVAEDTDCQKKENGLASDVPNREVDPHLTNQALVERKEEETEVRPLVEPPKVDVISKRGESDQSSEIQPNSTSRDSRDPEKHHASTDGGGENQITVAEGKDYHEKEINNFSSNVPKEVEDPHNVNLISYESEQEETVINAPAASPSNSTGSDTGDFQPVSPSKHSKDHKIPTESKLEENLQETSDHQLEEQTSVKKEEEINKNSTSETISPAYDPEPLKFEASKLDQPELAKIHADPPIQDSNRHIHEDILRANLTCTSEENGHPVNTKISEDMYETVVSGSNLEMEMNKDDLIVKEVTMEGEVFCEDRLEIEDGDEIGSNDFGQKRRKSDLPNGEGIKCDVEIPTEISPIATGSPKAEPEVTSMEESLNTHIEVSESADKCVVLGAETMLIGKESEHGEDKPNDFPTQFCEESVKESVTDNANLSQSEFLMIKSVEENNEKGIEDLTLGFDGNKDFIEDSNVGKNGHLVNQQTNDQIEAAVEHSKDSQKEPEEMVVESEIFLTESSLTDFKREEVSEERQLIGDIEEKTESSYGIGNNTEVEESGEQCLSTAFPVEQEGTSHPTVELSLVQPHEIGQNNEMQSKNIQSSNDSIPELKQETYDDIIVNEASCSASKMAETLVSAAELEIAKYELDFPNQTGRSLMAVAESGTPENYLNEECAKVEMPHLGSNDYQAQESVGRLSTESNPNNSNTQAEMQKSPSFGLDLRIEARTEESDGTPVLYLDKTTIEDFSTEADVSLGNPIEHTHSVQSTLPYHATPEPVEEKVVRMERSDSEKFKNPFLGFLKEEEEAHIIVTPQKRENNNTGKKANKETLDLQTKEVASTSPKSKEKRKARSSLFTNCMCCTTVIN